MHGMRRNLRVGRIVIYDEWLKIYVILQFRISAKIRTSREDAEIKEVDWNIERR